MKKLILIFVVFQLLHFSLHAQPAVTADDKKNLKQVNQQTVAAYQAGKLDEALKLAQQAVDFSVKVFGSEHAETATAYANLGAIYQAKKKYKDAAAGFEKAISIYRLQKSGTDEKTIAKILNDLAFVYALGADKKQAGETYLQALESAEKAYGKDSRELLPFLKSLAEFYSYFNRLDEAQDIFIRRYLLAAKYFPPRSEQLQEIEDEYYCLISGNAMQAAERSEKFHEAIYNVKITERSSDFKVVKGGIVTGNAEFLAKPDYPAAAKAQRAGGSIPVRVLIDENGKVMEAKAVCGDAVLRQASEEAAKKSKFTPFKIDGQPIKRSGYIIYNFVAG